MTAEMWRRRAQSRRRSGTGAASPGAGSASLSPSLVKTKTITVSAEARPFVDAIWRGALVRVDPIAREPPRHTHASTICTHTLTNTHTHTHTHTRVHIHIHSTRACTNTQPHTHTHAHALSKSPLRRASACALCRTTPHSWRTKCHAARSGQVRFITRPKSKRKKTFESQQNEGAEMSNELESARAMVVNLELLEPMVLVTMRPRPSRQVRRTCSEDHVSGHLDCTFPA